MMAKKRNAIMESIVKYFPPQLTTVSGMSTPVHMLEEAALQEKKRETEARMQSKQNRAENQGNDNPKKKMKKTLQLMKESEKEHKQ